MSPRWAAAETAPDCEASAKTLSELTGLEAQLEGLEGTKCQTKDLALTDELLKRRPDDVFLHLSYQQSAYPSVAERGKVIERYKQLADSQSRQLRVRLPICGRFGEHAYTGGDLAPEADSVRESPISVGASGIGQNLPAGQLYRPPSDGRAAERLLQRVSGIVQ
jgi:hypothetical protein